MQSNLTKALLLLLNIRSHQNSPGRKSYIPHCGIINHLISCSRTRSDIAGLPNTMKDTWSPKQHLQKHFSVWIIKIAPHKHSVSVRGHMKCVCASGAPLAHTFKSRFSLLTINTYKLIQFSVLAFITFPAAEVEEEKCFEVFVLYLNMIILCYFHTSVKLNFKGKNVTVFIWQSLLLAILQI